MARIYVLGHRNPDTDSIAAALAYAELRGRLDPDNSYVPVRLGDVNPQTRWVLDQAGVDEPRLLEHALLRARDVMQEEFPVAGVDDPVRDVGLEMATRGLDLMPILDDDGRLAGVMTERTLARRYIRESREASTLVDTPTRISAIAAAVEGEVLTGGDHEVAGRVWVFAMDPGWADSGISAGDIVVVGNRENAQLRAIHAGVDVLIVSNGVAPSERVLASAREHGTTVLLSPLDSYVCGRLTTLAAPCRSLMDREPLTMRRNELVQDIAELVKDVHYQAGVVVDRNGRPVGLVTRSDLVAPAPRKLILVDHAEMAQSVAGIEQAQIVEILDHHHIGSVETRLPVRATFDPVGSTSTLVAERFAQAYEQPSRSSATMLLAAILSDTVILRSPTTTERDERAAGHLAELLGIDAVEFGREMFEQGNDLAGADVRDLIRRDAKEYEVSGGLLTISQLEIVGKMLDDRLPEMLDALRAAQGADGQVLRAVMVTDILEGNTRLLVAGDLRAVETAFGTPAKDGVVELPGVMSRKKQVAPVVLAALS